MIPAREMKEKARGFGVPESTIERDYAQNWLLKHLYNLSMALKGGTGREDFGNAWDRSLRHQVKILPDFKKVYDDVIKEVTHYEPH